MQKSTECVMNANFLQGLVRKGTETNSAGIILLSYKSLVQMHLEYVYSPDYPISKDFRMKKPTE